VARKLPLSQSMPDEPTTRTLEHMEVATKELSLEKLMSRYRDCMAGGHVWRPLDEPSPGVRKAEHCGWCFRVRSAGFEGWLQPPAI
jgi:hypothetical protein